MFILQLLMLLPMVTMAASTASPSESQERVCKGTGLGLSFSGGAEARYRKLRRLYTNCTIVHGNLELNHLDEQDDYDLSFLSDIREVTGYVLISTVHAESIPLHNLRIIRGWSLFRYNGNNIALYVSLNFRPGSREIGLKQLPFTSLHEIMTGDVYIRYNAALCFHDTVLWQDILANGGSFANVYSERRISECGDCHPSCYSQFDGYRHCFGPGADQCQELRKVSCHAECPSFCFGSSSEECCHPECAGGCDGPGNDNCWACQNFDNDGVCVPNCPDPIIHDDNRDMMVPSFEGKYSFGSLCVDECPDHMSVSLDTCVKDCGDLMIDIDGVCQPCDGPCPKRCDGTDYYFLHGGPPTKPGSIQQFRECTVIEGSLSISSLSFSGNKYDRIPGIDVTDLAVLNNVHTIRGFLFIQADLPQFTNLSFLSNLETIGGQELGSYGESLQISWSSLESLGLTSLRRIENGRVIVADNSHLCYASTINWDPLLVSTSRRQRTYIVRDKDATDCEESGAVCDPECSPDGCWGPGPTQCLSCANEELANRTCISSCADLALHFVAEDGKCSPCHPKCAESCSGLGADSCAACAYVRDGSWCRSECPRDTYAAAAADESDDEDAEAGGDVMCLPCHERCDGCVGPSQDDCLHCRDSTSSYLFYGDQPQGEPRAQATPQPPTLSC